jgi:hypothetical protein
MKSGLQAAFCVLLKSTKLHATFGSAKVAPKPRPSSKTKMVAPQLVRSEPAELALWALKQSSVHTSASLVAPSVFERAGKTPSSGWLRMAKRKIDSSVWRKTERRTENT